MLETYADPIDRASVEQDRLLEENIRAALAARQDSVLPLVGECHNCAEPLKDQRFCDADCRDDYELRTARRRVNGA